MPHDVENNASDRFVAVRIWDLPVRLFHWFLVILVAGSWVSSEIGGNAMTYHMWLGYATLALVMFRFVWGFVGSKHARFSEFLRGPVAVVRYLRGADERPSYGHNPAGGWSVAALLTSLAVQATTGLFSNDEIATEGPLAARVGSDWSDLLTTVHRYNFYVLLTLICLHVAAVAYYLLVKRENLVRPMITGRKLLPTDSVIEERIVGSGVALVVLAIVAGLVTLLLKWA